MKFLRITDHKLFHSLNEREKIAYKAGVPIKFLGHNVQNMTFVDYTLGAELPKTISAPKQRKWATRLCAEMSRHTHGGGIIGCYSSPTDTAAFECAGSIFQAGVDAGMSCVCVSAARVAANLGDIPKNDLYVVYGVTDSANNQLDRYLSSFLYERDGSLRILVMSGSPSTNPWKIAQQQLHLRMDVLLVLNDEDGRNSIGNIEKVG